MTDTTKPLEWHIFNELVNAVKSAGVKNVYLSNRSKKMDGVSEFVVIDLPMSFDNLYAGNDDFYKRTTGVFYLGEKAKTDNTPNILNQTRFVQSIKDLFPIVDEHIEAVRPRVQFSGDDGSSFHITTITFQLKAKQLTI